MRCDEFLVDERRNPANSSWKVVVASHLFLHVSNTDLKQDCQAVVHGTFVMSCEGENISIRQELSESAYSFRFDG